MSSSSIFFSMQLSQAGDNFLIKIAQKVNLHIFPPTLFLSHEKHFFWLLNGRQKNNENIFNSAKWQPKQQQQRATRKMRKRQRENATFACIVIKSMKIKFSIWIRMTKFTCTANVAAAADTWTFFYLALECLYTVNSKNEIDNIAKRQKIQFSSDIFKFFFLLLDAKKAPAKIHSIQFETATIYISNPLRIQTKQKKEQRSSK